MNPRQLRNAIAAQCGFNKAKSMDEYDPLLAAYNNGDGDQRAKPYALQVCNAGKMPEDFDSWLKANGDSIEIGMPLDRTEATAQWIDDKTKTELPF